MGWTGLALAIACGAPETPREEHAGTAPLPAPLPAAVVRPVRNIVREDVPASMRPCWTCHRPIVESYLEHGMAASVGPLATPPVGVVENPASGNRYQMTHGPDGSFLETTLRHGGTRKQRLVGQIGAGLLDVSYVTAELDPWTGRDLGRLFFAPVEAVTGYGLALSPFDLHAGSPGPGFELNSDCLTCHTRTPLAALPAAAKGEGGEVFPRNALGADAFAHLQALDCSTCHGDPRRHLERAAGSGPSLADGDIGLVRLASLGAGAQRDVCARCHLQGEARFELVAEPSAEVPLAAQWPVLLPAKQGDDFRFVSQLERLALSACFEASPKMTCTTCHEAHVGVARQGTASFDTACAACHGNDCTRPPGLAVEAAAGVARRSELGCVDCHVRRTQPFDLPHVKSADHWVRRRIPPPAEVPHRQFADTKGALAVFDDGRLAAGFATPGGERWRSGLEAMGLASQGRFNAAAPAFAAFPAPGAAAARQPTAPAGWVALETSPVFHEIRALVAQVSNQPEAAVAANGDALAVAAARPGALLSRARLHFAMANWVGVVEDTERLIAAHPRSEAPWDLRAQMAFQLGRPDMALTALGRSAELWPLEPRVWQLLGSGLAAQGQAGEAAAAFARARQLDPTLAAAPGAGSP